MIDCACLHALSSFKLSSLFTTPCVAQYSTEIYVRRFPTPTPVLHHHSNNTLTRNKAPAAPLLCAPMEFTTPLQSFVPTENHNHNLFRTSTHPTEIKDSVQATQRQQHVYFKTVPRVCGRNRALAIIEQVLICLTAHGCGCGNWALGIGIMVRLDCLWDCGSMGLCGCFMRRVAHWRGLGLVPGFVLRGWFVDPWTRRSER